MSDANGFWLRKIAQMIAQKMKMPCLKLVAVLDSKVSKLNCVDYNECAADNLNSCSNIAGSYQSACNTGFNGHNKGFTGHLVGLTMTNVPMVTITAMLTLLVPITMVVSHAHVMLVTLVKVTMMIALISTNVLPIPKNVTMFPPVPIPSVHTSVVACLVMKELDMNVSTLTNVPLVHTPVLVI